MNTAIGMVLGFLVGLGLSQALSAGVAGHAWWPWLTVALTAALLLTGLCHWVRLTGGVRR